MDMKYVAKLSNTLFMGVSLPQKKDTASAKNEPILQLISQPNLLFSCFQSFHKMVCTQLDTKIKKIGE